MKKLLLLIAIAISSPILAQSRAELKKQKEQEKIAIIKSAIDNNSFKFVAKRAITALDDKPFVELTSNYYLLLQKDSVASVLPFYGRSYTSHYGNSGSPFEFSSTNNKIEKGTKQVKKDTVYLIKINSYPPNNKVIETFMEVMANGSATLNIRSNDYSIMTFYGSIEPL